MHIAINKHAYFYLHELCIASWGMCKWHLGFSFIVLHETLLHFSFSPQLLDFQCQLVSFDSTLIGIFGRLLRLGSLECSEAPLVCQQTFLPISKCGIGLVSMEVIALVMYLGSWGLIALIITSKFLQNNWPFIGGYKGKRFKSISIPSSL